MNPLPFIPKDHPDIPNNYGLKVSYLTGKIEEYELVSHLIHPETSLFQFSTKEELIYWVPLSSVTKIEFDKRFSKMMEIKSQTKQ